jgi:hypothetical protein
LFFKYMVFLLTSALDRGGWSMPRPGRFTPGEDPLPIVRRLGGSQGQSGRVGKMSSPQGFNLRTVQSVASRYTDYTIYIHGRENVLFQN